MRFFDGRFLRRVLLPPLLLFFLFPSPDAGVEAGQENTTSTDQTSEQTADMGQEAGQTADAAQKQDGSQTADAGGMMEDMLLVLCAVVLVVMLMADGSGESLDGMLSKATSLMSENSTLMLLVAGALLLKM